MPRTPAHGSSFFWLPIPEEGISRDVDPQIYGLPVDYHDLPEHLRARALSQRSGLISATSDNQVPHSLLPAPVTPQRGGLFRLSSTREVPASAPANVQQLVIALATLDREVPADIPRSPTSQQLAPGPGTNDGQHSETLRQPGVSPATGDDRNLEDDCRRNPEMQLFLQRHPDPDMQRKAILRDMVARRTLGELYHQHDQRSYNVIEKRANMTQDIDARAQELDGGIQQATPAGNERGKKKSMHYCRSCEEWFWDWQCRHVKHSHMQDPEDENDKLLICPDNLLGLRSPSRPRSRTLTSLEEIVSAHMLNHPHS